MLIITLCQFIIYLSNVGLSYEEELQAEAPSFNVTAIAPKENLEIVLDTLEDTYEPVYQYLVSVQNDNMKSCILWEYNCKSCKPREKRIKHKRIDSCHNNKISKNDKIVVEFYKFPGKLWFAVSNSSLLILGSTYTINAQAVNKFGYGKISSKTIQYNGYKSEAPQFEHVSEGFHPGSFKIFLNTTNSATSGKVFQYIVSVQSSKMKSCILWVYDCMDNFPEKIIFDGERVDKCFLVDSLKKIRVYARKCQTHLIFSVDDDSIMPDTTYTLKAQAFNEFGLGKIASITYTTSHKLPKSPRILHIYYSSLSEIMHIILDTTHDITENVFAYYVSAKSSNSCFIWEIILNAYIPQKTMTAGTKIDCFNQKRKTIYLYDNPSAFGISTYGMGVVTDLTKYKIMAQARNSYGFGNMFEGFMTTRGRKITEIDECYETPIGIDYKGTINTTKSGKTCQNWESQQPHPHGFLHLDKNYCRNPDMSPGGLWCYTTDPKVEKENCNVPTCQTKECLKSDHDKHYSGTQNISKSGVRCLNWNNHYNQSPKDKNYCRVIDSSGKPMCVIDGTLKKECDIPLCRDETHNLCLYSPTRQTSTFNKLHAKYAVDGNMGKDVKRDKLAMTQKGENQRWMIDLRRTYKIDYINLYPGVGLTEKSMENIHISVSDSVNDINDKCEKVTVNKYFFRIYCNGMSGRFIIIKQMADDHLSLREVQCFEKK